MDQTQNYPQMFNNFNNNLNNINPLFNINNYTMNENLLFNQNNQIDLMQMQNQMMMMNNPMQMNMNNQNEKDEYEDIYDYIKEEKKKIIFIRVIDNESFKVMVPCSLRKNELYFTANRYKRYKFSEMQLYHKGRFLSEDETSIDCVENGDEIKIIEELHGVDFSYYELYRLRHKNEPLINVIFTSINGNKRPFILSLNTSIEEMIKIFCFEFNIPYNKEEYFFFFIVEKNLIIMINLL